MSGISTGDGIMGSVVMLGSDGKRITDNKEIKMSVENRVKNREKVYNNKIEPTLYKH